MEFAKLRITAYWGPFVILVRGREGILFTCSQVKLEWSQNSFNTNIAYKLTLDNIQGTREEFTVKLTMEIILKGGQFPLIIEVSIVTGLIGTGPKTSLSSLTYKLRVLKVE